MWGTMIDGLISIGAGLVACYYGFRTPPATAKWQQWHQTWGKLVKIGGVCLVLFGLFTVLSEQAGVRFLDNDAGGGIGVRLAAHRWRPRGRETGGQWTCVTRSRGKQRPATPTICEMYGILGI